ncbi:hypothetical protein BV898_15862 [Hypsibius exemplaris]|uniref:Peptidase M12B domain-containing protein n=1 Tax=Hypsibius exemplaris TaxID=2072580 RepID=A0A9X6NC28_HYPEX|nr:hypothetical protein BV898_15862 [Hypsibius exemplaris]
MLLSTHASLLAFAYFVIATELPVKPPSTLPEKIRILSAAGIRNASDPSVFEQYDVFYLDLIPPPARQKRHAAKLLHHHDRVYSTVLFGEPTSLRLNRVAMTGRNFTVTSIGENETSVSSSNFDCHYEGLAESCRSSSNCQEGSAAVSNCGFGLHGYISFTDSLGNVTVLYLRSVGDSHNTSGPHLAKRILTLGDDLHATPHSTVSTSDIVIVDGDSLPITSSATDEPLRVNDPKSKYEGRSVVLPVVVFVDRPMVQQLAGRYRTLTDRTNMILAAFNAVQNLFNDPSFGPYGLRLEVSRVVFDTEGAGRIFDGNGEATDYLRDLCWSSRYADLVPDLSKDPQAILVGLTGLDIYGWADEVRRDATYAELAAVSPNNRVYGVTGYWSHRGNEPRRKRQQLQQSRPQNHVRRLGQTASRLVNLQCQKLP